MALPKSVWLQDVGVQLPHFWQPIKDTTEIILAKKKMYLIFIKFHNKFIKKDLVAGIFSNYNFKYLYSKLNISAITSISTKAPFGKVLTATAERAG